MTSVQELEDFMAKGIMGTGEGFDAPSAGRLGGSGFGAHNVNLTELRGKMVQVRPCSVLQEAIRYMLRPIPMEIAHCPGCHPS